MTEGMEDFTAGAATPPGSTSPTSSTVDTGQVPKEKPEEIEAAGESGEAGADGTAEGGGGGDGEHLGALGIVALPGTCCVCIEIEQINNCLHSEKICILPILACLLSLALCTAGLKWVFVDKIFEYEPPTHLDPKRIGQDPIIISVDPTLALTVSIPHSSASTVSLTTSNAIAPGRPNILVEEKSTQGPYVLDDPRVTQSDPSFTLKYNAERSNVTKQTPHAQTTQEFNNIIIPTISATSTTTTAKTSSHVTRCSDNQRNYCVNGGECFTLEIMPGSTKFLCRCPNEFTGDRCQNYVMASFYKAEELYQKRILTITGICIALLVVGIMCVVAYCKTKKQRKKLHDRLRQSLRKRRSNNTNAGTGPNLASSTRERQITNLPLQDFQPINQCNGKVMPHASEETEKTFSTSKYALSAHEPTTFTHISSQRSEFATTSPIQLSPESQTSLATPGSPPSEMSAPLSSLAISVPSVALSPSGGEESPLLLLKKRQPQKSSSRNEQRRTSVYYNHGHVAHSLPPSPLFSTENGNYQMIGDHDNTAANHMLSASPEKLLNTNNNINDCSIKGEGVNNGHLAYNVKSIGDSKLVSESEAPQGEHTLFLNTDSTAVLLLRAMYSSRTNPASPNDDLQVKSPSSATKQDPVAV